jgi:uncharacterized protein YerC
MITTIPAIEERLNIAKKMLKNTMDDAIILTITGISCEELQTVKKKIGSDYTNRRKS